MVHLARHHDALRHRFHRSEDGWVQEVDAGSVDVPLRYLDLAHYPPAERSAAIRRITVETQAGIDLATGPLLRAVYMDMGTQEAGRLLLVAHHLIIDGVSWRVLLEDLQTVLRQLGSDDPVSLPRKTTSYRRWAERLVEYAQSDAVKDQLPYWASLTKVPPVPLPGPHREIENTEAQANTVRVMLSHQDTQALLTEVPHVYGTEINDALLAALGQVLTRWTGDEAVFLDLEGHGRETIAPDVDVSRTVGWFTSVYPFRLSLNDPDDIGASLKEVKEQLRQIPERGIGYGLLRYLTKDADVSQQMARVPQPQIIFNYLGRFQESGDGLFALATESVEPSRSPRARRKHLLDISGSIVDGRLAIEWAYPTELYTQGTIQRLAEQYVQALQDIIAHCQSPDAGGYTPSDFQDVDLGEDDLEAILSEISEAANAE
jgi:non-ribosomal peptide synthase protein (TIGR01720 family)